MKKKSELKITIEGWDEDGLGIGQVEGRELKVAGSCTGDELAVRIDHLSDHKPVGWASIVSILKRGSGFVRPSCIHASPLQGQCGGCPLMHLDQEAQETVKKKRVEKALKQNDIHIDFKHHRATQPMGYRNRAHYIAANSTRGNTPILGSYAPRSHEVVSMHGCSVVHTNIEAARQTLVNLIKELNVPLHPAPHGLRYLSLRVGHDEELLVDVTTNSEAPQWLNNFCERIISGKIAAGITISINSDTGNAIRVAPPRHHSGIMSITEKTSLLSLRSDAATFYQLNSEVAHRMYNAASDLLPSPVDVLWDLYCGVGGLGLTCAKQGKSKHVYGAEFSEESLNYAREAAQKHDLSATFQRQDLSRGIPQNWPDPQAIILNPPRRGCDEPVLASLAATKPTYLIYMSCNPKTFAADARRIIDSGYTLQHLESHDMLPQTKHIELLGAFTRL